MKIRHLSPLVQEMCLIPDLPSIGEKSIIFSNKTFCAHIRNKNTHCLILFSKLLVDIRNHRKKLQDLLNNIAKIMTCVTFAHSITIFID